MAKTDPGTTPVTAYVSPETKVALQLLADRRQRSISYIVGELIGKRIEEFEKEVGTTA